MCVAPLFLCDSVPFLPPHVLAAAAVWGKLDAVRQRVRLGLGAMHWARANEYAVDDDAVQEASETFRREHGLRSARATQDWLEARSVSLDDFGDYLERHEFIALHARLQPGAMALPMEEEIKPLLWPELVFSGGMVALCRNLARRVAVAADAGELSAPASGKEEDAVRAYEARFEQFAAHAITPARLESALRNRWGDLFRVDCEMARFPSVEVAREARLCVAEDGAELITIARAAGGAYRAGVTLLSDLPEPLRSGVQTAGEGTLLPVLAWDDGHVVCRVRAKREPSLEDGDTRTRVEQHVVEEAVAPLVAHYITWVCEGL